MKPRIPWDSEQPVTLTVTAGTVLALYSSLSSAIMVGMQAEKNGRATDDHPEYMAALYRASEECRKALGLPQSVDARIKVEVAFETGFIK